MRRTGLVVAAATALALGAGGGTARAEATVLADVSASWGDRVQLRFTWTERHTVEGGTVTVTDTTCDDRPVYVSVAVTTGAGRTVPLGDRHHTGGCGTSAEFHDIAASDGSGIRRLALMICRDGGTCETRYTGANPYRLDALAV
ncbi:hypothetical protein ACF1G0_24970 [Streptomyces sp. NPDC013953]|uniref:hypothetical protein n=1 Tax=Streptomyces sp. NPDC013953 TaxID=3364868 RepID=UPI0036FF02E4